MKFIEKVGCLKEKVVTFVNPKLMVGATTVALATTNVFAEGTGATSALDLTGVDFSIVIATVASVIAVGVVPMLTIAAAKKGVTLLMSLVKKA